MDSSTCSICELHSLVLPPVVPIGDEHETVPINNQVLNKYMCPPGYHQNPSVITILDLWQLLHMGTGRTVTHQDFPIKKKHLRAQTESSEQCVALISGNLKVSQ